VDLEHGKLPDPVAEAITLVLREQDEMKERLRRLESAIGMGGLAHGELVEEEEEEVVGELGGAGGT